MNTIDSTKLIELAKADYIMLKEKGKEGEEVLHYNGFLDGFARGLHEGSNPWHKASEELPKVDKYRKCIKVFARKGDDVFVAFYSVMAGFSLSSSFYTEYALSGITHWMPIPEIKEDRI